LPVPDRFDPAALAAVLDRVPEAAWSLPSDYAVTHVHHGYRRVPLVTSGYRHQPYEGWFADVLDEFSPVVDAWLSALDPGGFIVPHADGGPWWERWHLPIVAAGTVTFGETFTPTAGRPFPVAHWELHWLGNDTDRRRVTLVVDRAVRVDQPWAPFLRAPVPADLQPLIERSVHAARP
jgi:hypothetical protein